MAIKKIKVICDTSVWYYLADNPDVVLNDVELIATHNNFIELVYSRKIINNFVKYRNACAALIKYTKPSKNILKNPILYAIHLIDPNFVDTKNSVGYSNSLYEEVLRISKLPDNYFNYQINKVEIQSIIDKRNNENNFCNDNNFLADMKRKSSISKEERVHYARNNYEKLFRELLLKYFELYSNSSAFNYNDFFWNEINLFSKIHQTYYLKLETDKSIKIKNNDLIDLFNLLYVGQESYYWIEERRWVNIFREAKMSKYLFSPVGRNLFTNLF